MQSAKLILTNFHSDLHIVSFCLSNSPTKHPNERFDPVLRFFGNIELFRHNTKKGSVEISTLPRFVVKNYIIWGIYL